MELTYVIRGGDHESNRWSLKDKFVRKWTNVTYVHLGNFFLSIWVIFPFKKNETYNVTVPNLNAPFLSSLFSEVRITNTSIWDQAQAQVRREKKRKMEGIEGERSEGSRYALKPTRISNEDILLCVDVDAESLVEMKSTGPNGRPLTRLDSIKQAILLFINAKLSINPEHRFAFASLSKSASWVISHLSLSLCLTVSIFSSN